MNELLLHEAGLGSLPGSLTVPSTASSSSKSPTPGGGAELLRESSSSSEGEGEGGGSGWPTAETVQEMSGDESSDEEFTMKVWL